MTSLRARTWTCWVCARSPKPGNVDLAAHDRSIAEGRGGAERLPESPAAALCAARHPSDGSTEPPPGSWGLCASSGRPGKPTGLNACLAAIPAERNICSVAESLPGKRSCIPLQACLPVPADSDRSAMQEGRLLDMYARSDITALAKGNSYSRLQWEEVTVGQALSLAQQPAQVWLIVGSARVGRLLLQCSWQRACCAHDLKR